MDALRLSPTQIGVWCVCHHAWYLQYQEKRSRPPMGTIPKFGIILHNLVQSVAASQIFGEKYLVPVADDYVDEILQTAQSAGEVLTEPAARAEIELVLSHVEVFRGAFLPRLQPVAIEEAWNWLVEDPETGDTADVYCRGDLRDARGFWLDHKLKNKIPSARSSVPAADLLEQIILTAACSRTHDSVLQLYAKGGRKQVVLPLHLTGGTDRLFPDVETLRDRAAIMVLGMARGIRAGDSAPTGLYTERWGRQTCYYCDWRKTGQCKYQGGH